MEMVKEEQVVKLAIQKKLVELPVSQLMKVADVTDILLDLLGEASEVSASEIQASTS